MKEKFFSLSRTFKKDVEIRAFLAICYTNSFETNDSLMIANILFTTRKSTLYHKLTGAKKAIITEKGKELIEKINSSADFKLIIF